MWDRSLSYSHQRKEGRKEGRKELRNDESRGKTYLQKKGKKRRKKMKNHVIFSSNRGKNGGER